MGHERVGVLPKTKRWQAIVHTMATRGDLLDTQDVAALSHATLLGVRKRFDEVARDPGVRAAFAFLVSLASQAPAGEGLAGRDTNSLKKAGQGAVVAGLLAAVREANHPTEYGAMAERAACSALAEWSQQELRQAALIDADPWRRASRGDGFSEIARSFFAKYTESYLKYFLGREAGGALPNAAARERFDAAVRDHAEAVSKHALETTKIAQSFAAGWFNKNAIERRPSNSSLNGFLRHTFEKLRSELLRESEA